MMMDFEELDGLKTQVMECLEHAYTKGYKQGQVDGVIAMSKNLELKDEIKVGDEVKYADELNDPDALSFVITRIYEGKYEGICPDGACYDDLTKYDPIAKTGRHFDVESFLKQME